MAIRIPILTSFDPKGLKQANAEFGKLQSSVGSLGRNFAVAGAAIAAAGAVIAKNAQSLARIEAINAQTAQTIKSMGNVAGISATQVETLAGSLEKLTATEAESIQEGANLLLTFGNIRDSLGAGNDIFTQTTKIMVDLGVALKRGPVQTATMLGKALNDPIKGLTALTRVGVSFSEQQKEQVKALQQSGDLMGAQKVILAELQKQYGGSGAAFAKTFNGQLELMGHELGTIGEEATMAVMPALQGMVAELRTLIPIIGPQLKAAIESVDWKGLVTAVVDFTRFLVENAGAIAKAVAALFLLNTAYKLVTVAVGIGKVAIALHTWAVAQSTAGMGAASVAAKGLSVAMRLIPWVAVAGGIALVATEIANSGPKFNAYKKQFEQLDTSVTNVNPTMSAFALTALDIQAEYLPVVKLLKDVVTWMGLIPKQVTSKINVEVEATSRNTALNNYLGFLGGRAAEANGGSAPLDLTGTNATTTPGGARPKREPSLAEQLEKDARIVKKQTQLVNAGVSEGLAARITAGSAPIKRANKFLRDIKKNNGKLTKGIKGMEKNLKTATRETVEVIEDTSVADALKEKERVYASFADSVKNTFAGIKNSIMGAFDITQLGGSTDAITRNMDKLLVRLRSFATNVKSLASMGLNPALLQQVISAGPMAGARLAESLVLGGAGALSAINAGYTEFGSLSSQIAQTGTEAMFGTSAQQSIYNISVNGGVGSGATIGAAIVDAIKAYERTSGAVWQGA